MDKDERKRKWLEFVLTLNPDIAPESVRLMSEVRQVAHALRLIAEGSIATTGLSYAQYSVLLHILAEEAVEGRSELNPSEISRRQGVSRNTISSLIRNLEDEGLIARHLDLNDRRKFNICLTAAGRTKVEEHAHEHMRIIAGCFESLSDEEQEELSQLLAKLSQHINQARDSLTEQASDR